MPIHHETPSNRGKLRFTQGLIATAGASLVACSGSGDAGFGDLIGAGGSIGHRPDSGLIPDVRIFPPSPEASSGGADVRGSRNEDAPDDRLDATWTPPDGGSAPESAAPDAVEVIRRDANADDANAEASLAAGAPLHAQRWELPCTTPPLPNDKRLCSSLPPGFTACPMDHRLLDWTVTFGGDYGTRYAVTLRLRGVVELKAYGEGTSAGSHVQIGGTSAPGVVNAYGISVSSPSQTYYFNADHAGAGEVVVDLDDTVTIPIDGGASIELFATDNDCIELRNCVDAAAAVCVPHVVPGVPPAPNAFDGQFVQVDVVSVVRD